MVKIKILTMQIKLIKQNLGENHNLNRHPIVNKIPLPKLGLEVLLIKAKCKI